MSWLVRRIVAGLVGIAPAVVAPALVTLPADTAVAQTAVTMAPGAPPSITASAVGDTRIVPIARP